MEYQNFTTPCSPCYRFELPEFPADDITIAGQLPANTALIWTVEQTNGNIWNGKITTDGDGDAIIPIDAFPEGLFAHGSGAFLIYFRQEDSDEAEDMTLGLSYGGLYECISLTFYRNKSTYTYQTTIE